MAWTQKVNPITEEQWDTYLREQRKERMRRRPVQIDFAAIEEFEPFKALEIHAIRIVNSQCEWVSYDDPNVEFFSVYGQTGDDLYHCIADCFTLKSARNLARAFNIFAGFSLHIIEHPKV